MAQQEGYMRFTVTLEQGKDAVGGAYNRCIHGAIGWQMKHVLP